MELRHLNLHQLKIFESAGRHLSFKKAAEELNLTPSSVSHQVKALEEHLGFPLFQRLNRRIEFTSGGKAYYDVVHDGLDRLMDGTQRVLSRFSQKRLKISMMRSLASHFFIPRLPDLKEQFPSIDLDIDANADMVDFKNSDVDLAIRFGNGPWPHLHCEKISNISTSPMCSPKLLEKYSVESLHDLHQLPLIGFSFMTDSWDRFARSCKLNNFPTDKQLTFNNYDMAIQAAEEGLGVVLGLVELEQSQLNSQRLVQLFDVRFPMKQALYLVYRESDHERRAIRNLREWLKQQFDNLYHSETLLHSTPINTSPLAT